MAFIHVQNLDGDGRLVHGSFRGAPCIRMRYSFQKPSTSSTGQYGLSGIKSAIALLDTGADFNVIEETLVPDGVLHIEDIQSQGVTGTRMSKNYEITLHIVESDSFQETGAITMPARLDRPYQMILGRKFLQSTRFRYDGHLGITDLEYFENVLAR